MMKTLILGLVLFIEMIIQSTVFQFFDFHGYYPDLLLITIVCLSIVYKREYTYKLGLMVGFFVDILYGSVMGFYALCFLLTAYFVSLISNKIYMEAYFAPVVIFPFGVAIFHTIKYIVSYLLRVNVALGDYVTQFGLIYWVINFIFLLMIYPIILKFASSQLFKSQTRI